MITKWCPFNYSLVSESDFDYCPSIVTFFFLFFFWGGEGREEKFTLPQAFAAPLSKDL